MGLGGRLAIVFAVVAGSTALLVGGASYLTTGNQITSEVDEFLENRLDEIVQGERDLPRDRRDNNGGNGAGNNSDDSNSNDAGETVVLTVTPDAEVQQLDESGVVVSNSGLLLPIDEFDLALVGSDGPSVLRTVDIDGVDYRMITEHLSGGGAVQIARSLQESSVILEVLQTRLLLIAGSMALLAAGAGWIVAQRTTRPLRSLTRAVDAVAETGDLSVPVEASGSDEVGRLANGFNRMLGALELSQEQQRRLVQDAAHELRTPLTSVSANIDWLIRADNLDTETRVETLSGIRRELRELNDVMSEIIELATDTRQTPEHEPVDLAAVAANAVDLFQQRTGREVSTSICASTVIGDRDSLARAITNLLSNAEKYSPNDASIELHAGPQGVFVDDAGPGIPAAERERVFDRFYRRVEDRSSPGSGLGLAIVASIVDHHGGNVLVTDSALGGARVGFVLPAS